MISQRDSQLSLRLCNWSYYLVLVSICLMVALYTLAGSTGLALPAAAMANSPRFFVDKKRPKKAWQVAFLAVGSMGLSLVVGLLYATDWIYERQITPTIICLNSAAIVIWLIGLAMLAMSIKQVRTPSATLAS